MMFLRRFVTMSLPLGPSMLMMSSAPMLVPGSVLQLRDKSAPMLLSKFQDKLMRLNVKLNTPKNVASFTFSLISLSWNLLNNILALLSRSWSALPCTNIGALLIINILGHRGRDIVANLLRNVITNLTRLIDIIANLLGDWLTNISLVSGALTI